MLDALAVVLEEPGRLVVRPVTVDSPAEDDVVVKTVFTGVSTGTERLFYTGRMPPFPGMGYPLVPGYESVGEVVEAGPEAGVAVGERVFVPGARCFGAVRGLHGGAASRLVTPASRVLPVPESLGDKAVLLALAATAQHALAGGALGSRHAAAAHGESSAPPSEDCLIVGHGVLGRLLARLAVLAGGVAPTVWEKNVARAGGAEGYAVVAPEADPRRNYRTIIDVSGDPGILDALVQRLAPGGEIVLAGFYSDPLSFAFAPAFMREARIRIAAQWSAQDMAAVAQFVADGRLSLDGLITHRRSALEAPAAYPIAFDDPSCLKMVLDWSACA